MHSVDMARVAEFFVEVQSALDAQGSGLSVRDILPSEPFGSRVPASFPSKDQRFAVKKNRLFCCDSCGAEVTRSAQSLRTVYKRTDCEFAGSWVDPSWKGLPGKFQEEAWKLQLINATWHCHDNCNNVCTLGQQTKRQRRAAEFENRPYNAKRSRVFRIQV